MEEMTRSVVLISFLGVLLVIQNIIKFSFGSSTVNIFCNERERQALLTFKQHLQDPCNHLSSWDDDTAAGDCCRWNGVVCNNKTHDQSVVVTQLQLGRLGLRGELNPSLLELKHLNYLDLSLNDFNISIPPFLGSLHKLRFLDLAGDGNFVGMIPSQLGNLSSLRHLDMFGSELLNAGDDLEWLSHLSSLEYLDLSYVNLSKASSSSSSSSNWLHSINMLPSLLELHLSQCDLRSIPSDFSLAYLIYLTIIFRNQFQKLLVT
ncbi:Leucine-rich repeat [Macleaya cordata]|uniref:Leucine-rich repeat n=1 Tax=Macleaya cordata TaxID=56857 RepID=A0A200QUD0_MACCD|nr:Leucine-rich repeat [Macleaya cordata]